MTDKRMSVVEGLRFAVEQLTAKLADAEARLALTRGCFEGETAEVNRHQKRVDSLKTSILGLQELLDASEAQVTRAEDHFTKSQALLEGMTTEAKRHAARAEQIEAELSELELQRLRESAMATGRRVELESELARAHAHHMFGVWVDGPPADRVGALYYLRNHGLPEATPDDLDAACEGLVTPWGSGPIPACNSCEWAKKVNADSDPGPDTLQARCAEHGLTDSAF